MSWWHFTHPPRFSTDMLVQLVGWLFGMFILSHSLTFLVVYLVSKHFPDEQINVWDILPLPLLPFSITS